MTNPTKSGRHVSGDFFSHAKRKAGYRKIPFEVTREELEQLIVAQDFRCAYTDQVISVAGHKKYSGSLDRIDSSKGYTLDNVQFVQKECNIAKNALTEEAFFDMVEKIYKHKIAYQGIDPDQGIS